MGSYERCPHSPKSYPHDWHGFPHSNCLGSHLPPEEALPPVLEKPAVTWDDYQSQNTWAKWFEGVVQRSED